MKAKISKWFIVALQILIVAVCMATSNIVAHAQTPGEFSVHAVIPDNQVDTKQTYFDLRMKPGDEQKIQVVITNSQEEELVAKVRLNNASTGRNGLIVYTESAEPNEVMKVSVTDVATPQEQIVTVPAHGSETVTINIKMPDEPFDGVILGGISVTENEADDNAQEAQGVSLKNTVTYVIAVKLTENNDEVEPDFDLIDITPSLINYRTSVIATLQNKAPRIVKEMEVKAQVFKKNSESAIHELNLIDAEMAPMSNGSFVIDWKNQPLNQGTYRLRMTADYLGRTWEWDKEFTISGEAANLNKEAVDLEKDDTWFYWVIGIAMLLLVWIVAYGLGKRKKKTKTETDEQNV